ncbi:tetratricopeptide repeat protein [Bradyrhizobium sp. HKCCYLR20261]|uniref:tetratricopeptide repeat protein n=1 Tax=Bradyrhizobium sp. HKCCYLR20261 TaxID=3420760 RepID=UPI003EBAED01
MPPPSFNAIDERSAARPAFVDPLREALRRSRVVVLRGAHGLGLRASAQAAARSVAGPDIETADGDWQRHGYLAGFEDMLLGLLRRGETAYPDVVARHEQSLKRLWPFRTSACFKVPRDLTNTSDRDERTRFYHHEYQNKLLVGAAEFALDMLEVTARTVSLIIDNAQAMSPTSRNLLDTMLRRQGERARLRIILLDRSAAALPPQWPLIDVLPWAKHEFDALFDEGRLRRAQRDLVYDRSGGNLAVAAVIVRCMAQGINATDRLDVEAMVHLHLATLSQEARIAMARAFVANRMDGDLIEQCNVASLPDELIDTLNIEAHARLLSAHRGGEGPLVLAHALAVRDRFRRAEALCEPSAILMGIGLYDTWFAYFAAMFGDADLRRHGSGDDAVNGMFINAAFVLYAMGFAPSALRYLEFFLAHFPDSRFVPTALYAQSMTYGRYQVPVDLDRAEACAVANLALIDQRFRAHPRYKYIKVFAENAYAYIRARRGDLRGALALCEHGMAEIVEAYGEQQFRLHRSILIYNTSQVYELAGDSARAEARLRDAIACDPFYAEYYNDLGNLLGRLPGREHEAAEAYARAIALSPPYYEAHLNRGMLRVELGDFEGAAADFERALQIKPSEWRAMRELGNIGLLRGDARGALGLYERAMAHEAGDADLYANAGLAASDLGDVRKAMAYAQAAIEINPRHPGANNNLAAELLASGDLDRAAGHARVAAEDRSDPDYAANLDVIEALLAERNAAVRGAPPTRH